jgi:hypothetical protein
MRHINTSEQRSASCALANAFAVHLFLAEFLSSQLLDYAERHSNLLHTLQLHCIGASNESETVHQHVIHLRFSLAPIRRLLMILVPIIVAH